MSVSQGKFQGNNFFRGNSRGKFFIEWAVAFFELQPLSIYMDKIPTIELAVQMRYFSQTRSERSKKENYVTAFSVRIERDIEM